MMAAQVSLVSALPRDLHPDALVNHGSFLINLEGEEKGAVISLIRLSYSGHLLLGNCCICQFSKPDKPLFC